MSRSRKVAFASVVGAAALGSGVASAAVGDLDAGSFGTTGTNTIGVGSASSANEIGIQGSQFVVGGTGLTSDDRAVLLRFNSNGNSDTTFNGTGAFIGTYDAVASAFINGIDMRSDNKIVTAGYTEETGVEVPIIAQHLAGGALDTANFAAVSGFITNPLTGGAVDARFNDVVVNPVDDKVVGAGTTIDGSSDDDLLLLGLTSDATRDSAFGVGGPMGEPVGQTQTDASDLLGDPGNDRVNAIAFSPGATSGTSDDGYIVVGSVNSTADTDNGDVMAGRYTLAGVRDTGNFGSNGVRSHDIAAGDQSDFATDVAVLPNGKILIAGTTSGMGVDHFVMRLNANGSIDNSFGDGSDGVTVGGVGGVDLGEALAVLPDGRFYVGGTRVSTSEDWVVSRYTAAGLPDTSFDPDGTRIYNFGADDGEIEDLAIQPDGKILVSGSIDGDLSVGRLKADDPPVVITPPNVVTPPSQVSQPPAKKKCKKPRKLKKGKCVKKKKKRKR